MAQRTPVIILNGKPGRFPLRRILDVLRGRVRRFPGSGWCEQGLLDITVQPVASPTLEQLQFVQRERADLGNLLQVRRVLQVGESFGYGMLAPEAAEQATKRLRELGLPYVITPSRVWRPIA